MTLNAPSDDALVAAAAAGEAAAARAFADTPERMGVFAALIGITSALAGLWASYTFDTPTGPSIVCVAALCFVLAGVARLATRQKA